MVSSTTALGIVHDDDVLSVVAPEGQALRRLLSTMLDSLLSGCSACSAEVEENKRAAAVEVGPAQLGLNCLSSTFDEDVVDGGGSDADATAATAGSDSAVVSDVFDT